LPAALSGLTAAFIVAISRAIGETMVVFIAGGASDAAILTFNPRDPPFDRRRYLAGNAPSV
ncbi:MAG: phosphate ABC transporter permease subunit PstC, partial [Planctomycetota bacterium]